MFFTSIKKTGKYFLWPGVILLIFVLILSSYYFRTGQQEKPQDQAIINFTLGLPLQPSSALLIIALEKGFFRNNGLTVTVRDYPSGKRALHEGLFTGEVDVAGTADFPVTIAGMKRKDFRIIASTFATDDVNSIIARRDAGIDEARDLQGKHVGTQKGSAVHYFLHLFLLKHGLSEKDVFLSYMKAEELPVALAQGRIDAFSMREPYIGQAKELLGGNSVVFSAPGLYEQQELLLIREETMRENPTLIRRILKSLLEAEAYIRENHEEVIAITAERLDTDRAFLGSLWPKFLFRLSLEQSLLIRLENEARWAIRVKLVESRDVPNYLKLIQMDELQALQADAVTIH